MLSNFLRFLNGFRTRANINVIVRGLAQSMLCFISGLHFYFIIWLHTSPTSSALRLFNIGLRVTLALVILYFVMNAYRRLFSHLDVARLLDKQIDHKDDLYQNTYELAKENPKDVIAKSLSETAVARFLVNKYHVPGVFTSAQVFIVLFIVVGIASIWAMSWDDFSRAFFQFYTNRAEQIEYKNFIELSPGSVTIGKRDHVLIQVLNPDPRLRHQLYYRSDKEWRELALTDNQYLFTSVESDFEYYVTNLYAKSPVYQISCLDEPYVSRWEVNYKYPPHTGLNTKRDTLNQGNIEAYKHTDVILSIRSNVSLKRATLKFDDGNDVSMLKIDPFNYSVQIKALRAQAWYLDMEDILGRKNQPEHKWISIIPDTPPELRIVFPGEDTTLDQSMLLPLIISATDDFGLRNLSLKYQLNENAVQSVLIQSVISSRIYNRDFMFDMRSLGLMPGDRVSYWTEIYDNSPDNQLTKSSKYMARFPSIEEIYREIERQESLKTSDLERIKNASRDIQKDFEQKRRELLKDPTLKWDDKKQLENILQQQDQLNQQVENIAQDFQDLISKMQVNQALSPETLQKMQKIQELMEEISNDDLRKAMDKFGDALKNMDPEALRKAMDNFRFSMDDFNQRIDQTLQLLESIKKEQAAEKALQMSREMEKMQSTLNERTPDSKQNASELSQSQQNVSEKFEALKDELDKLNKMLDPAKDKKHKDMLDDIRKDMQNSKLEQDIQKSADNLSQNQRSAAMQAQQQALEKMRRFTQKLSEMKQSMGSGSQQQVMSAMQMAIRELLLFSKRHEELSKRLGADPYPIMQELIAHYDGLQILLNKLFSTPQITMFIPPKFFIDLTDTNRGYREVFMNVSEMQYSRIPELLLEIQRGINLMIYDLMQALNNPSQGSGSGSGMQSLMQMLEQMGQEQMAMNMLTEQLFMQMQQQGGRMDAAMQQQIQKLASDQQRLAENLKRALQNNPEAQRQGNAVKQIIEEAEAIARQLRSNQMSADVLRRQENIISRMLDAQRSINKRETTQKRKGETSQQQFKQNDGQINMESLRRAAMLDDGYKIYPQAYQQMIIKYLKYLNDMAQ